MEGRNRFQFFFSQLLLLHRSIFARVDRDTGRLIPHYKVRQIRTFTTLHRGAFQQRRLYLGRRSRRPRLNRGKVAYLGAAAAHESHRVILRVKEATAISFHRSSATAARRHGDVNPIDEVHLPPGRVRRHARNESAPPPPRALSQSFRRSASVIETRSSVRRRRERAGNRRHHTSSPVRHLLPPPSWIFKISNF